MEEGTIHQGHQQASGTAQDVDDGSTWGRRKQYQSNSVSK